MKVCGIEIPAGNYMNGQWIDGTAEKLEVLDKYSQQALGTIHQVTDTEGAVQAAQKGYEHLKHMSAGQRRELLESFLSAFQDLQEDLVELVIAEAGKPRDYAAVEVKRCQSTLQDALEESVRIAGEVVPMDFSIGAGKSAFTQHRGAGIVLAISPFNFPLNLALHKIAPAIAAGCPVILRPSPFTPLCALALGVIAQKAKWPGEILQVLNTPIAETQRLVEDKRIRVLSFTGSDKVGWMLRDLAHQKNVLLELGGNASLYIDEGTNIEGLGKKLVGAAFLYAGQICISTQRIYVHHSLFEQVKKDMLAEVAKIKVGDPGLSENLYGPMIDENALKRTHEWVQSDVASGAELLCGGEVLDGQKRLYSATILSKTTREMHVHKDEFFAPVVSLDSVSGAEEAFQRMNDSSYGLQAGVYTLKIDTMQKAFANLDVGAVVINNVPGFRIDNMPYGGVKSSGLGREGARYSIESYSERVLCII